MATVQDVGCASISRRYMSLSAVTSCLFYVLSSSGHIPSHLEPHSTASGLKEGYHRPLCHVVACRHPAGSDCRSSHDDKRPEFTFAVS